MLGKKIGFSGKTTTNKQNQNTVETPHHRIINFDKFQEILDNGAFADFIQDGGNAQIQPTYWDACIPSLSQQG